MSITGTKGVDISYANGNIDLEKVKKAGYGWVMIRCGYGSDITSQDDSQFASNVAKAEKLGMPWGVYLFSYACSASAAKSELAHIDRLLKAQAKKGYYTTLPVALDMEYSDYVKNNGGWNSSNLTNVATIILDGLKNLGYYPMIYTGGSELKMLSDHIRKDYDCWFAQWYTSPTDYKYNRLGMWQYGGETNYIESNSISGVGTIDKNMAYKEYPTIIKNGGYNGWSKSSGGSTTTTTTPPTTTTQPATSTGNPAIKEVQTWLNKNYKTGIFSSSRKEISIEDEECRNLSAKIIKSEFQGVLSNHLSISSDKNALRYSVSVEAPGEVSVYDSFYGFFSDGGRTMFIIPDFPPQKITIDFTSPQRPDMKIIISAIYKTEFENKIVRQSIYIDQNIPSH